MASRYPPLQVLGGAMTGLALVMGLAVGAGGVVAAYVPPPVIAVASGLFFVIMGLFTLYQKEEEQGPQAGKGGFYRTATLIFVAELGDKTQMAALLLCAHSGCPLAVFTGAMAGMFLNHALAVFLGAVIFPGSPSLLKITAALFIFIGLVMLLLLALGRV